MRCVAHVHSARGGHLLVFGTAEVIPHAGRDERAILDAVLAAWQAPRPLAAAHAGRS